MWQTHVKHTWRQRWGIKRRSDRWCGIEILYNAYLSFSMQKPTTTVLNLMRVATFCMCERRGENVNANQLMLPNQLQCSIISRPFMSSKLHDGIRAYGEWRIVKWTEEPLEPQATTVEVKTRPFHWLLQHQMSELTASRPKTPRKTQAPQSHGDITFLPHAADGIINYCYAHWLEPGCTQADTKDRPHSAKSDAMLCVCEEIVKLLTGGNYQGIFVWFV